MKDDRPAGPYISFLRDIARGRAGLGVRILATLISGLLTAALALAATWLVSGLSRNAFQPPYPRFHVLDGEVALALLGAGAAWLGILYWIWRGGRSSRVPLGAILGSLSIGIGTGVAMPVIDHYVVNEEEQLMVAAALWGAAMILILWLPVAQRRTKNTPLVSDDGIVQLFCPECRYSMVGLREARCPECGTAFTIDELFVRQECLGLDASRIPAGVAITPPDGSRRGDHGPTVDHASSVDHRSETHSISCPK